MMLALGAPAAAQVADVDPDAAIDGDLAGETIAPPQQRDTRELPPIEGPSAVPVGPEADAQDIPSPPDAAADASDEDAPAVAILDDGTTYQQDDLIGAASGLFGDGARDVAMMIEGILKNQGRPNGYIVGREGGGAFIVGLRYGSGTLFHKIEGQRPVYWTGPSIGFDAGANAGNAFVLVYNLYDTQDLYTRFPAAEGQLYAIGGVTASYLRKGDIVLIPIRVGAGLRAGVNAGYLKLTEKQSWLPF